MDPGVFAGLVGFGLIALVACVIVVICHWARLTICFLGAINCPCYREARAIASLIYEHPGQWSGDECRLIHSKLGAIWIASGADHIRIKTPFGEHRFGAVERQIIWDAVQWRIRDYVSNRIAVAMQANALPRS
jgi:hypothetical protein